MDRRLTTLSSGKGSESLAVCEIAREGELEGFKREQVSALPNQEGLSSFASTHLIPRAGGQGVAGSNLVIPTNKDGPDQGAGQARFPGYGGGTHQVPLGGN